MGQDDANEGYEDGECFDHDFTLEGVVMVERPGSFIPGLAQELRCTWCGAVAYEPSNAELPPAV